MALCVGVDGPCINLFVACIMSVYEIGILSAFLTLFLNYCIGKPGSEFSPYEIFSGYTVWLAKRKLKIVGLYNQYENQLHDSFKQTNSLYKRIEITNDFNKIIYNAAEPFFTWERAAGMCPVCTGVWISLITALCFTNNLIEVSVIIVTSHITIRILSKLM